MCIETKLFEALFRILSTVRREVEILVEEANLKETKITYTGGESGWKGDTPRFLLSTEKMAKLGWKAKHSSEEAVRIATKLTVRERLKKTT